MEQTKPHSPPPVGVDVNKYPYDRFLAHVGSWLWSLVGTSIGGGVFGLLIGMVSSAGSVGIVIICPIVGFFVAGAFAVPVHITVGVGVFDWLNGYRRLVASGFAGAASGCFAVACLFLLVTPSVGVASAVGVALLAAVLGGTGATIGSVVFTRRSELGRQLHERGRDTPWQFSLKSVFIQTALISLVILMWIAIYKMLFVAQWHIEA